MSWSSPPSQVPPESDQASQIDPPRMPAGRRHSASALRVTYNDRNRSSVRRDAGSVTEPNVFRNRSSSTDSVRRARRNAVSSLPDHGPDDSGFDAMRNLLFTDHDVLILFDPAMDGAEIPDGLPRAQRYANLHPTGVVQAVRLEPTPTGGLGRIDPPAVIGRGT